MAGVDRTSLMNYLARSVTTLHAEDLRLGHILARVKRERTISTEDFEALIDAQQTALRSPANVMMMVLSYMEAGNDLSGASQEPTPISSRVRLAVRVLRGH